MDTKTLIIIVLTLVVALDQALAAIPTIKSNAVYQLVTNTLVTVLNLEKE